MDDDRDEGRTLDADEAPTRASGPDEAPTQALGPDEAPTQALGGAGRAGGPPPQTAGPAAPPPAPPQVTVRRDRGGGPPWWLWLVLAAVAAAAVASWLLLRPGRTPAGEEFLGSWTPAERPQGGLVISRLDDRFRVVQFDAALAEVARSTAELRDGALAVQVRADVLGLGDDDQLRPGTLTHDPATDRLVLHVELPGLGTTTVEFVRTDVLRPLPATSAPATPTASPASTPTPATPTPSPSASADVEKDQRVIEGIGRLQAGITEWASDHGGLYPPVAEVAPTAGLATYVDPWPENPFSGQPMRSGTLPGDYVYEQLDGGRGYRLTGFLSGGRTYAVP